MRLILPLLVLSVSVLAWAKTAEQLRSTCPILTDIPYSDLYQKGCKVIDFSQFGKSNGRVLFLGEYRPNKLPPNDEFDREDAKAYALFDGAQSGTECQLIWKGGGGQGGWIKKPEIIDTKFGQMIVTHQGSGNGVYYDNYFRWDGWHWKKIDWDGWKSEIKLPKGYALKAIPFEPKDFTYHSDVGKPDDCHACATGGRVAARLDLKGDKIVLLDYQYVPPSP